MRPPTFASYTEKQCELFAKASFWALEIHETKDMPNKLSNWQVRGRNKFILGVPLTVAPGVEVEGFWVLATGATRLDALRAACAVVWAVMGTNERNTMQHIMRSQRWSLMAWVRKLMRRSKRCMTMR